MYNNIHVVCCCGLSRSQAIVVQTRKTLSATRLHNLSYEDCLCVVERVFLYMLYYNVYWSIGFIYLYMYYVYMYKFVCGELMCVNITIHFSKVYVLEKRIITNQSNRGWISADRSTKATLMLTIPRYIIKSSTKDLSWPTCGIMFLLPWLLVPVAQLYDVDPEAIAIRVTSVKVNIVAYQHGFWLRGVQS